VLASWRLTLSQEMRGEYLETIKRLGTTILFNSSWRNENKGR